MCLTGPDARRWDGTIAMDNEENNGQGYRAVHLGEHGALEFILASQES